MAKDLHALDYLAQPAKHPAAPVCVVFGDEEFLKRQTIRRLREEVLGPEDGDYSLAQFDGGAAVLPDVIAELATVAMFGRGRRLVVLEKADPFVTRYRADLEDYVARPCPSGVLVLDLKSWPANTRLYKAVAAGGLTIDCASPSAAKLTKWVIAWAKQRHQVAVEAAAAEMLIEMIGPELGLLDQELGRLAVSVGSADSPSDRREESPQSRSLGSAGKITVQTVASHVGTWRAKTAWEMLDAALGGNPREALIELDRLLLAGENPIAVLAQISASLRRLATATRRVLQSEAAGRRLPLRTALEQAGVPAFVLGKAEGQLRRLGRHRGAQLHRWLLEADLGLKGASALPPRLILERLIVRLAARELAAGGAT